MNKTVSPLESGANVTATNYTLYCLCNKGFSGVNCAVRFVLPPDTVIVLSAAAIAGIVVGIAVFLCIGGGSAYAAATFMGTGVVTPVINNPLYRGDGFKGNNPLSHL